MTQAAQRWAEQARYDLETAQAMLESGRYLYVLFCCQQAMEKLLKALILERTGQFPPRIHSLPRLAGEVGLETDAELADFLGELSVYYIQTRYPEEMDSLGAAVDRDLSAETLRKTQETAQWLLSMLK